MPSPHPLTALIKALREIALAEPPDLGLGKPVDSFWLAIGRPAHLLRTFARGRRYEADSIKAAMQSSDVSAYLDALEIKANPLHPKIEDRINSAIESLENWHTEFDQKANPSLERAERENSSPAHCKPIDPSPGIYPTLPRGVNECLARRAEILATLSRFAVFLERCPADNSGTEASYGAENTKPAADAAPPQVPINQLAREILLVLLRAKAFGDSPPLDAGRIEGRLSMKGITSTAHNITRVIGKHLKAPRLVESRTGHTGGYFLTDTGKVAAQHIESGL